MKVFLGVDIGNTKSHALVTNEQGRVLGFGQGGPGSWEAVGWSGAQKALQAIVGQALAAAAVSPAEISGAGFGFAGYDWPEDRPGHEDLVESLQLSNARVVLGNDTLVGLAAGAEAGWGLVVSAGTSNNCRGWDRHGVEGRITGDGSRFAEYGGATELVAKAVQAVGLAWTRRGPETALSAAFAATVGADSTADLISGLVRNRYHLEAAHAPLVFQVASRGDAVAQDLVRWTGSQLGSLANGVIGQLKLQGESFDVVLAGSLYKGSPVVQAEMEKTIHALAPGARLLPLKVPPVMGGIVLALRKCNVYSAELRETLVQSVSERLRFAL